MPASMLNLRDVTIRRWATRALNNTSWRRRSSAREQVSRAKRRIEALTGRVVTELAKWTTTRTRFHQGGADVYRTLHPHQIRSQTAVSAAYQAWQRRLRIQNCRWCNGSVHRVVPGNSRRGVFDGNDHHPGTDGSGPPPEHSFGNF